MSSGCAYFLFFSFTSILLCLFFLFWSARLSSRITCAMCVRVCLGAASRIIIIQVTKCRLPPRDLYYYYYCTIVSVVSNITRLFEIHVSSFEREASNTMQKTQRHTTMKLRWVVRVTRHTCYTVTHIEKGEGAPSQPPPLPQWRWPDANSHIHVTIWCDTHILAMAAHPWPIHR